MWHGNGALMDKQLWADKNICDKSSRTGEPDVRKTHTVIRRQEVNGQFIPQSPDIKSDTAIRSGLRIDGNTLILISLRSDICSKAGSHDARTAGKGLILNAFFISPYTDSSREWLNEIDIGSYWLKLRPILSDVPTMFNHRI